MSLATLYKKLDELSKRCPKCKGTKLSSRTKGGELWHRCLDCGWNGRDSKTLPCIAAVRARSSL